jgi:AmmeMemoRadiSam system protein B
MIEALALLAAASKDCWMSRAYERPKLRSIEVIVVPDGKSERALMLRDGERIAERSITIPAHLVAVVARFDGRRTLLEIAEAASKELGQPVALSLVETVARELDDAFMLESPRFAARRSELVASFAASSARPAAHAGGAYHREPRALTRFIETACFAKAPSKSPEGEMIGLCAPHMDLWRAAAGYGHAYRACSAALPHDVDTLVLLGTSHAPMRQPFAVCDKTFETPLGPLEPDEDAIDELARGSRFDVREDQYLHKGEHSLEFQAVFLRHVLGHRQARIVPILCGLGEAQGRGKDPSRFADAESFLSALRELVEKRKGRVLLVAGADLAHVGPRFGDPRPYDEDERAGLAKRDRASIDLAIAGDAPAFFADVAADLETRRVCGLGPIYTMLRAMPDRARGELLHYNQCVDPEEGSIVSHTSLGYYAA